jgi:hypothetical protein
MYGLESCIDLDLIEAQRVCDILKSESLTDEGGSRGTSVNHIVSSIMLRARFNPQRHYEIYTVQVDDSIEINEIKAMFEFDPQGSSDLIRQRGNKLYSDRMPNDRQKIF